MMKRSFSLKQNISLFLSVIILALVLGSLQMCTQVSEVLKETEYGVPSLSNLIEEKPAITTDLSDAVTEVPFIDDFNPEDVAPLTRLDRGPHNGFLLDRPGLFELKCKSYCLHAGSYAPRKGDGYIYAPLKGPRAKMIQKILQRSVDHPEIPQTMVQTLIWAILAHAKINDMPQDMQDAASKLLAQEDINDLNQRALNVIRDEVSQKAWGHLPAPARRALEAENRLRSLLSTTSASYEELERVAVLAGAPEGTEGGREIPKGRWSYHPDGYFVRYLPSSYRETLYQISVPEPYKIERDAEKRIKTISDVLENRIEFEYDDQIAPLNVPGDTNVMAYRLKWVRFINYRAIGPEIVQERTATWENTGWTLVGKPGGQGRDVEHSGQFPDLNQRYRDAQVLEKQVVSFVKKAQSLKDAGSRKTSKDDAYRDPADLAHLDVGLNTAIGGDLGGRDPWIREHALMVKKAWQFAVCEIIGSSRSYPYAKLPEPLLIASLSPMMIGGGEDICDNPPKSSEDSPEADPSNGSAVPGNSDAQRLAPSAAGIDSGDPDPDCDKVGKIKNEMETVRDAFKNNKPHPGEDGFEYAKRIEGMFGSGEPGGAFSPAHTTLGCGIDGNANYYKNQPSIILAADCAHEKTHQAKCRWARDNVTGGYGTWMMNAWNYRQNEIDAYNAGIKVLEDWMNKNGCGK
jgi:hypothetical protein